MQPACDQDAQIQQVLDRLGLTRSRCCITTIRLGTACRRRPGGSGRAFPNGSFRPSRDGLRWLFNPETLHEAKGIMKHGEWLPAGCATHPRCPLYPRKRTFSVRRRCPLSAISGRLQSKGKGPRFGVQA